ncbi:MAG: hypothetical protein MRY21_02315 [Simkaniaceae bacterium]|nr:hypothetical protein [Simkaniaceae bacterium]
MPEARSQDFPLQKESPEHIESPQRHFSPLVKRQAGLQVRDFFKIVRVIQMQAI